MGSKGLPNKNRILFESTASIIPSDKKDDVWVTTDDPVIEGMARDWGFNVIERPEALATDEASMRDVIHHAINEMADSNDVITVLYLTYPSRSWEDVVSAMEFFSEFLQFGIADSLLCKKDVKVHPYLHMYEHGVGGLFGRQIIPHDLCRRQEYPPCFEISHFIVILRASAIMTMNRNMYHDKTVFFKIDDPIDVDTKEHLEGLANEDLVQAN